MDTPAFFTLDAVTDHKGKPLAGYRPLLAAPSFLFTPPQPGKPLPLAAFCKKRGRVILYRVITSSFVGKAENGDLLTRDERIALRPIARPACWVPMEWLMLSLDLDATVPICEAQFGTVALHVEYVADGQYAFLHPQTGQTLMEIQLGPDWLYYIRRKKDLILYLTNQGKRKFQVLNGYCFWKKAALETGESICYHIP